MTAISELQTQGYYVFDNSWEHARRRLTLLEQCFDAGTIRRLQSLGVQPGWRCLEAGAGAGSVARWLCSRTAEDLPRASYAGLFTTVLDVRGNAALRDAVSRCWASARASRVIAYAGDVGGRAVAALARQVEQVWGGPQDVEWAVTGTGTLVMLQARPVTTLPTSWSRRSYCR